MMNQINAAVCFATINRPFSAHKLIKSIRRLYPDISIYVADQSPRNRMLEAFYRSNNVTVVWMPFDAGVTTSRNALIPHVKEDFFILCDDDFVFIRDNHIEDTIDILRSNASLGIVGGRLKDVWNGQEYDRHWELYLHLDRKMRTLTSVPVYYAYPISDVAGDKRYFYCDAVMNWFVARTDMFRQGVRWDDQFKSAGEHEDFFLNLKLNTEWRVAYYPPMLARHEPPTTKGYFNLRSRSDGWRLFMEKWGVDQMFEINDSIRSRLYPQEIVPSQLDRPGYFMSMDHRRNRKDNLKVKGLDLYPDRVGVHGINNFEPSGKATEAAPRWGKLQIAGPEAVTVIEPAQVRPSYEPAQLIPVSVLNPVLVLPQAVASNEELVCWQFGNARTDGKELVLLWRDQSGKALGAFPHKFPFGTQGEWGPIHIPQPPFGHRRLTLQILDQDNEVLSESKISFLTAVQEPAPNAFVVSAA